MQTNKQTVELQVIGLSAPTLITAVKVKCSSAEVDHAFDFRPCHFHAVILGSLFTHMIKFSRIQCDCATARISV